MSYDLAAFLFTFAFWSALFALGQAYFELRSKDGLVHRLRRDWAFSYAKCCKKRDEISYLLAHDHSTEGIESLPLAMARAFEEKNCSNPARVKEEDRALCEQLQDFRRHGRMLLAEVTFDRRHGHLTEKEYYEAVNIFLPVMALDAANAKVILKSDVALDSFGSLVLLLLLIDDEANLRIFAGAKGYLGKLPTDLSYVLDEAKRYRNTLPRESREFELLDDFIDDSLGE